MGKVIAFCNQKGGVGKTTSAVNISSYVSQMKQKTLLIDADPQANATSGMGLDKKSGHPGTYELLMGLASAEDVIVSGPLKNLDIVQSSVSLTGAEIELVDLERREFILKEQLRPLRLKYDYIFIDCPPSLGLLTLNCLVASDSVVIPLQCEYYALEGLSQLMDTVGLVKQALNNELVLEGVILTMADFRTRLTGEVIKEVRSFFNDSVYDTIIPRSIRLSEAPGFGQPIMMYDELSVGAQRYKALAKEIIAKQSKLKDSADAAALAREAIQKNVAGSGNQENLSLNVSNDDAKTQLYRAITADMKQNAEEQKNDFNEN